MNTNTEIYFLEWQAEDGSWMRQLQINSIDDAPAALDQLSADSNVEKSKWRVATYEFKSVQSVNWTASKNENR